MTKIIALTRRSGSATYQENLARRKILVILVLSVIPYSTVKQSNNKQ